MYRTCSNHISAYLDADKVGVSLLETHLDNVHLYSKHFLKQIKKKKKIVNILLHDKVKQLIER